MDLSKSKKFKNKKFGNLTHVPNIGAMRKPTFPTSDAKKTFNRIRQAFIEALIF